MEAFIQYKGDINDNYNRFGKVIPKEEKRIDIKSFFECDNQKEQFIINKLLNDNKVFFKLVKPAGDTARKFVEEIEKKAEENTEIKKRGRPKRGE